jgi:hypothetical protein
MIKILNGRDLFNHSAFSAFFCFLIGLIFCLYIFLYAGNAYSQNLDDVTLPPPLPDDLIIDIDKAEKITPPPQPLQAPDIRAIGIGEEIDNAKNENNELDNKAPNQHKKKRDTATPPLLIIEFSPSLTLLKRDQYTKLRGFAAIKDFHSKIVTLQTSGDWLNEIEINNPDQNLNKRKQQALRLAHARGGVLKRYLMSLGLPEKNIFIEAIFQPFEKTWGGKSYIYVH